MVLAVGEAVKETDVRHHHVMAMLAVPEKLCVKCGAMVSRWHRHWDYDKTGAVRKGYPVPFVDPMRGKS